MKFGTEGGKIRSTLLTCNLSDAPKYYSLSYCWGLPDRPLSILCDERDLQVSPGLHEALTHLRPTFRTDTIHYFWIDQICVNQGDPDERAQQVQLMRKIYGQAYRTLVWLGPFDAEADGKIFDLLDRIDQARSTHQLKNGEQAAESVSEAENRSLGLPDFESPDWADLTRFFERPWFYRQWVIQEAALSKEPPRILCGDIVYPWDDLATAIYWLEHQGYSSKTALRSTTVTARFIHTIRFYWDRWAAQPLLWHLEALLLTVREIKATDPRDHIYALLGLCVDAIRSPTEPALVPDYRRRFIDVFGMVTRYCIRQSDRLAILGCGASDLDAEHRMKALQDGFPSWVPRWDLPTTPESSKAVVRHVSNFEDAHHVIGERRGGVLNAAQGLGVQLRETGDPRTLVLKALPVGAIDWCSDVIKWADFDLDRWDTNPFRRIWETMLDYSEYDVSAHDAAFLEFARAFYLTIGTGHAGTGGAARAAPMRNFWRYMACCYLDVRAGPGLKWRSRMLGVCNELRGWAGDESRVTPTVVGMRLFFTEDCQVGHGPAALEEGDRLFVVFGSDVPLILRKVADGYLLVGEAYVPSLMDGQAVTWWRSGSLKEEWVTLR